MANYATLKAAIQQVVKTNGNNEITGALLQQSLLAMINSLGVGYQYIGIATPATNPGTPDQNVFYLASTAGTYTNFGGLVLDDGEIAILKYNGAWAKDSTGAASLKKFNQLAQQVIMDGVLNPSPTLNAGYIDTTGAIQLSQNFSYSVPIKVYPNDVVKVIATSGAANFCVIAETNEGGTSRTPKVNAVLNQTDYEYTYIATTITYITICGRTNNATLTCSINRASREYIYDELATIMETFGIYGEYSDNPEYVRAYTDADGRFLWGIKTDGSIEWAKGIPKPIKDYVAGAIALTETLQEMTDLEGRIEMTLDADDRVISYRDGDGTLVENVGIKTKSLSMPQKGMEKLAQALKAVGIGGGAGDWSDRSSLDIPKPKIIVLNFTTADGSAATWPQTKTADFNYWMQFWDMDGNYFRKRVIFNAQGNSSLAYPKKNGAIDICNDEWIGDDTFSLRIGNWVAQDSFHIKAYYTDAFRAGCPVSYQLFDEMSKTRGVFDDYVWKRGLIDFSDISATSNGASTLAESLATFDTGARCFPDGIPCLVYLDGTFYGVYAWQLKKHRDNYHLVNDVANNIHLDGAITNAMLTANGDSSAINWNPTANYGLEVRNPKDSCFVTTDGMEYDADSNRTQELAGLAYGGTANAYDAATTYSAFDIVSFDGRLYMSRVSGNVGNDPSAASYGSKPKKVWDKATTYWVEITFTNQVRQYILALTTRLSAVSAASTTSAKKAVFETYFDVANLIDYLILSDVVDNRDGFEKNWQWVSYDGTKWFILPYDIDISFGNNYLVSETRFTPRTTHCSTINVFGVLETLYQSELEARYKDLRDAGIIDARHITDLMSDWMAKIGPNFYTQEYEKWDGSTRFDSLFRLNKWLSEEIANMDTLYNY